MDAVRTKESVIREVVQRSSMVLSHYWPMTGFVHHNPIRSLEIHRFHDAVKVAERFIGGRGYLTNEQYRSLVQSGRIRLEHLDAALRPLATDPALQIAGRNVSHIDVLRAHLLNGITVPDLDTMDKLLERSNALGNGKSLISIRDQSDFSLDVIDQLRLSRRQIMSLAEQLGSVESKVDEELLVGRKMSLIPWLDRTCHTKLEWLINFEMIKWCEAFLDEGLASLPMPDREKGFYCVWKSLASKEWSPCGIPDSSRKIASLPWSPDEALALHLEALAIPPEVQQDYLSFELTSLYGWASFINWRADHADYPWQAAYPIDLVQYLAVRMFYVRELVELTCRSELGLDGKYEEIVDYERELVRLADRSGSALGAAWRLAVLASSLDIEPDKFVAVETENLQKLSTWLDEFPESDHGPVWLEAYEAGYHADLFQKLKESVKDSTEDSKGRSRPIAQALFCIDVRSEPFRRNLESVANYETLGFAGFFGIPMRCRAFGQEHETDQLPAIVQPTFKVYETYRGDDAKALRRHNSGEAIIHSIHEMLRDLKLHVLTPYVMVESLGWLFGIQLFGRTLFPRSYRRARAALRRFIAPPVGTVMSVDREASGFGLSEEEQAASIETGLRTMGLVKNFARLVVVAGHTSTSDNNPYEAALNCGACGGNSGKPNARLFAAMANKAHVREHLAKNGIEIPEDTHFIGAVHDTTTDRIEFFDVEELPDSHSKDFERLKADMSSATLRTNLERCGRLPGAGSELSVEQALNEIDRRSGDWSETRPEWGLAGNAAFIIGRRSLTGSLNLEGRVFLNSYDYRIDSSGSLLEGILNGPMVVGQWINAEHYFSATDTEVYGSGSKVYHNVVGSIGIMTGPRSDLRTGLAWQSMMNGEQVYHEPLRLLVVIEAPRERIHEIFERSDTLKQLRDNEWIHLIAIDYEGEENFYRFRPAEGWEPVLSDSADADSFRIYIGNDRKRKVSAEA